MDRQSRNWILRSEFGAVAALAACLCAAATPLPISLAEPARAAGPEVLEELDEVVLHGKRLELRLQEAEQRFYDLYNVLNERDDLDVTCRFLYLDRSTPGSRSLGIRQGCVPVYVASAITPASQSPRRETSARPLQNEPTALFYEGRHYTRPGWSGKSGSALAAVPASVATAELPEVLARKLAGSLIARPSESKDNALQVMHEPGQLVWMSRRSEFEAQVAGVVARDERLQVLARELNELAAEGRESIAMMNAGRQLGMEERKCVSAPRAPRRCQD